MVNIKQQSAFQTVVFLVLCEGLMMSFPLFHPENIQCILDGSSTIDADSNAADKKKRKVEVLHLLK